MKTQLLKKLTKWNKIIIAEEAKLQIDYGLRNKKELQRIYFKISKIKKVNNENNDYEIVKAKLIKQGVLEQSQSLLDISTELFLKRRLQTVVALKYNLSLKNSRHFITAGHIKLKECKVKSPSQIISLDQEKYLFLNPKLKNNNEQK